MRIPGREKQIIENFKCFSKLTLREKLRVYYAQKEWIKKMKGIALNAQKLRDRKDYKK